MVDMVCVNATDVRKDFSSYMDTAVRVRPVFVKRTRDYLCLADVGLLQSLVSSVPLVATIFPEEDGTVTLSLDAVDLVVNEPTLEQARASLATDLLEYAQDYYEHFPVWSASPNRSAHLPYVFKALIAKNIQEIEGMLQCHAGVN